MFKTLLNYLFIAATSIYLVYGYLIHISDDRIISKVTKVDNKMHYMWEKKSRLALLLDEFSNTPDCIKSYGYLTYLINGTDSNLNPT